MYNEVIEERGECKVLGKLRDSVYHFPPECVRVLHHFILIRCHPHIDKSAEIEINIEIEVGSMANMSVVRRKVIDSVEGRGANRAVSFSKQHNTDVFQDCSSRHTTQGHEEKKQNDVCCLKNGYHS